jgi:hypothetical protein
LKKLGKIYETIHIKLKIYRYFIYLKIEQVLSMIFTGSDIKIEKLFNENEDEQVS